MLLRFFLLIILIKKSTSATVINNELKEGNLKLYLLVTSISKRIDELLFLEIIRIASRSPRYRAA